MGRKRFRDSPFYKQNASLGRKRFRDGYGRHKQNAPTLGRKRFRDSPFYKQNAPLGRKRFRDSPFYKQNAPLGRKRFRDGYGRHKQNAPTLGRKKFCLMIYSLITLSFYFQKIPLQSERNASSSFWLLFFCLTFFCLMKAVCCYLKRQMNRKNLSLLSRSDYHF